MNRIVKDFLEDEKVAVLTTILRNGTPHAAAMHYAHKQEPLTLYFSTRSSSRKCQAMLDGEDSRAAVAIGFDEKEWVAFQAEGKIKIVKNPEIVSEIRKVLYKKHPQSREYENDPETIYLECDIDWWRFSDYKTKIPSIISSED